MAKRSYSRHIVFAVLAVGLLYSFIFNESWLQLCSGLAFFLFGMQCMEDGLQQLAGSKLEQLLAKSTATPIKGLFFGIGSTMILQSTTVVSLLTIAFISTGLITLAGGITIILGANLGASSGIWLLALAGQNISLSQFAYPMIVLGVLAAFNGKRSRALGRVVLGIAFILLAIDLIKVGFSAFTTDLDFTQYQSSGFLGVLVFVGIGLFITVILQSSHATLMLILTALSLNQIGLEQSFALAIGSNVGSAVMTGIMGFLGGDKSGRRLALAHVIFNVVTALLTLILLAPLTWLVAEISHFLFLNNLIQLALFHTLFNVIGVVIFWIAQYKLADLLKQWIPDEVKPKVLITEVVDSRQKVMSDEKVIVSRYLTDNALTSTETAISAVIQELEHLGRISLEVICHALYLPIEQLSINKVDKALLIKAPKEHKEQSLNADDLYKHYVKGIYSDLLTFMGRIDIPEEDTEQKEVFMNCQVVALQLVNAVKDAKHLQKNLKRYLRLPESITRSFYVELREYILNNLRETYQLGELRPSKDFNVSILKSLSSESSKFDLRFRNQLFLSVRNNQLDGYNTSSLMNDLGYATRIVKSLYGVLMLGFGNGLGVLDDEPSESTISG